MPEQKTKPTKMKVADFIKAQPSEQRRAECRQLVTLMKAATGKPPVMWGPSIVGFGKYHYKYPSGHEGDCFLAGFSPRKAALTVYIMAGFGSMAADLKQLGRHKKSVSCLYINRLEDIDLKVLARMTRASVKAVEKLYQPAPARRKARA